ncbi:MAG TPA: DUF4097 family beta strand repeat-containing protein, partial [Pyrinomonadaceae bacterium]|nr:DUF4097 family beta strand repeat-containing protein [Pyrinomonadaceae bacterium]
MTWLYSIVFAGLLFSSNGSVPAGNAVSRAVEPSLFIKAAKQDETEKFEQTYPLSANGKVSVSNINGSIVVEAWDRNEVKLEATKIADSKETLADVDIKVDSRPDSLSVEADYGSWKRDRDGSWRNNRKIEVQFHLFVPRTAMLNEIETVNGSVTVSNFTNFTKISAVNGDILATNLRGVAELSTVNGKVMADFDRLESSSRINLSTVNGSVNVIVPSDANATFKADSLNGNITNDFGLPVRKGKYVGRDLHGRVGSGEIPIRLSSVNGPLSIGRRNDGRSTNPATNLLEQKNVQDEDSDDNDDNDGMSAVNVENVNRAAARAVKESQKHSAKAMKDAQKEIANIKPTLDNMHLEELAKIKVSIDTEKLESNVRESLLKQKEVFAKMADIRWQGAVPTILKKSNSFPVKGVPKVVIDAKGCGVKVRGWDKPEVQYVLTEISGRRDRTPVTVEENVTADGVSLRVPNAARPDTEGFSFGEDSNIRIEVFVPRKSDLKITTDGEIRLDGVSG